MPQKMHASGITQAAWDARNKPKQMVSTPGVTDKQYSVSRRGRVLDDRGLSISEKDRQRLARTVGTKETQQRDAAGNVTSAFMAPDVARAQVSTDPNQQIGSRLIPTAQDRVGALQPDKKIPWDQWKSKYGTQGDRTTMQEGRYSQMTQPRQQAAPYQPTRGTQADPIRGVVGEQVQAGYTAPGTGQGTWRPGQVDQPGMGFSPEQDEYLRQLKMSMGETYDPYLQQYDAAMENINKSYQDVMSNTQGLYDAQIDQIRSQTENLLAQSKQDTAAALESTASRFAFSGFGRSTDHLEAQAQVQEEAIRYQNSIRQEMLAKEALMRAENAGASAEHLATMSANVQKMAQQRLGIQQSMMETEQSARLSMLQTNEQSRAMAEVESEKQAQEQITAQNEYLKMQGKMINPFTGQIENLPAGASPVNVELSKAAGYMMDDYGNPMLDDYGQPRSITGQTKYQIQSDQMGGMYVFDPTTGQVVSQYDAFGNVTGGMPGMGAFTGFFGGAANVDAIVSGIQGELSNIPKSGARGSNVFGEGTVTGYGSNYWKHGLDFVLDGGMGAQVNAPVGGEVIQVDTGRKKGDKNSFGNRVKIRTSNGDEIWVSHLASTSVNVGDQVQQGQPIGGQGNTGSVYGRTGIHLDVTMKKPDGSYYTPQEVQAYLQIAGKAPTGQAPSFGQAPGGITQEAAYQEAVSRGLTGVDAITAAKTWMQAGYIPEEEGAAGVETSAAYKAAKQSQVMDTLDQVIGSLDWSNTGVVGAMSANIPGTSAYNLSKQIDTLKANIGFGELQAMREASKTGGALGQVSERELDFLNSVLGSMDIGQSKEQLQGNLEDIRNSLEVFYNAGGAQFMQGAPSIPGTSTGGITLTGSDGKQYQYSDPNDPEIAEGRAAGFFQ